MTTPRSASLFEDGHDIEYSLVAVLDNGKSVTKAQQQFRRLVLKIEQNRALLRQWQEYSVRYNQRLAGELEPLRAQLHEGQRKMAILIDELLSQPAKDRRLGRVQRGKLRQLLSEVLDALPDDSSDEAMAALYVKYGEAAARRRRPSDLELTQTVLNDVLGLEIGADHGASSVDELLALAQRKLQERADKEAFPSDVRRFTRRGRRTGNTTGRRDTEAAERLAAERDVGQSLRDVFRKLVSALHPDREPDTEARERKTLLMQRVNQAYEANDLLTLLNLQLEIEQINAAHLSSLTPQRLAHYNEILREQLTELDAELERTMEPYLYAMEWHGGRRPTPPDVDRHLSASIAELRSVVRGLQNDLVAFRDPDALRELLKRYEPQQEIADLIDLADLIDVFQPVRRSRRSRR
jgi:hypothetical protein